MDQHCSGPENIHTPPKEGIGISWGGGFCKTKLFKEMYEAQSEFPEGWGLRKFPSVGDVWIFAGTAHLPTHIYQTDIRAYSVVSHSLNC